MSLNWNLRISLLELKKLPTGLHGNVSAADKVTGICSNQQTIELDPQPWPGPEIAAASQAAQWSPGLLPRVLETLTE